MAVALVIAAVLAAAPADLIVIDKSDRQMRLYADGEEIARYRVALGFAPEGDKGRQGDGKTPEGRYAISWKNPRSQFHLSLKLSYPDAADRAGAKRRGVDPGGDIFIHGTPGTTGLPAALISRRDWTLGCIAVSNGEIEEIWRLVEVGTAVEIRP